MSSASQNRVIWHYMRTAPSDGSQELVAEHVEEGSKTDQFIQRAEKRRRSQECHRGIDMRGKTKEECRAYLYRNLSMHLDRDTYQAFVEALNRGVAIFAKVCFGHPSPSKQQKLHATVYAYGAPTVLRTLRNHLFAALHNSLSDSTPT